MQACIAAVLCLQCGLNCGVLTQLLDGVGLGQTVVGKHFADNLAEDFLLALLLPVVIVIIIISANESGFALDNVRNSSERGGLLELYSILGSYT